MQQATLTRIDFGEWLSRRPSTTLFDRLAKCQKLVRLECRYLISRVELEASNIDDMVSIVKFVVRGVGNSNPRHHRFPYLSSQIEKAAQTEKQTS